MFLTRQIEIKTILQEKQFLRPSRSKKKKDKNNFD